LERGGGEEHGTLIGEDHLRAYRVVYVGHDRDRGRTAEMVQYEKSTDKWRHRDVTPIHTVGALRTSDLLVSGQYFRQTPGLQLRIQRDA
jgi:hypothetical protein